MIGSVYHQDKVCLFSCHVIHLRMKKKTNKNSAICILHLFHGVDTNVQKKVSEQNLTLRDYFNHFIVFRRQPANTKNCFDADTLGCYLDTKNYGSFEEQTVLFPVPLSETFNVTKCAEKCRSMGLSHSASNKYGMRMFSVSYQTFALIQYSSLLTLVLCGSSWSISVMIGSVRVELGNAYKKLLKFQMSPLINVDNHRLHKI